MKAPLQSDSARRSSSAEASDRAWLLSTAPFSSPDQGYLDIDADLTSKTQQSRRTPPATETVPLQQLLHHDRDQVWSMRPGDAYRLSEGHGDGFCDWSDENAPSWSRLAEHTATFGALAYDRSATENRHHRAMKRGADVYLTRDSTEPLALGLAGPISLSQDSEGGGGTSGNTHRGDSGGVSDSRDAAPGSSRATSPPTVSPPQTRSRAHSQHASSSATTAKSPESVKDEQEEEQQDEDEDLDESSSDSDTNRKKGSPAFRPRGRKKRNKCSPEQLEALEAFFAKNRNPTGRIREELSKRLRMPERSVQVWFQNRRAKIKTLEKRGLDPAAYVPPLRRKRADGKAEDSQKAATPSTSRVPRSSVRAEKPEAPSVTALPTTALCIGSWRRVSPLVCFFSRRLQMLSWYLSSDSIGFKLEMPWTSIRSASFEGPTQPSLAERQEGVRHPLGHFVIELSRPPTFFMEVFRSVDPGGEQKAETKKTAWRQCADFTEGHQATRNRLHILSGPYEELRQAVVAFAKSNDALEKLVHFRDAEGAETTAGKAGAQAGASIEDIQHAATTDVREPVRSSLQPRIGEAALQSPLQRAEHSEWANVSVSAWQAYRTMSMSENGSTWDLQGSIDLTSSASHSSASAYPMSASAGYTSFSEAHVHHHHHHINPRQALSQVDLGTLKLDPSGLTGLGSPRIEISRADGESLVEQRHDSFQSLQSWQEPLTERGPAGALQWNESVQPYSGFGGLSGGASEPLARCFSDRQGAVPDPQHEGTSQPHSFSSSPAFGTARRREMLDDDALDAPLSAARHPLSIHPYHDRGDNSSGPAHIHPALMTSSNDGFRREQEQQNEPEGDELRHFESKRGAVGESHRPLQPLESEGGSFRSVQREEDR